MKTNGARQSFWVAATLAAAGLSGCGNEVGEENENALQTTGEIESSAFESLPQAQQLQYPVAELGFPSDEVTGAVTNVEEE